MTMPNHCLPDDPSPCSYMVAAGLFDRSGLLTTDEEGNVIVGADVPAMGGQEGPGRPFTLQPTPTDVLVGAELVERTSVSSATGPGRAQGPPARNLLGGHDADHAVKVCCGWGKNLLLSGKQKAS